MLICYVFCFVFFKISSFCFQFSVNGIQKNFRLICLIINEAFFNQIGHIVSTVEQFSCVFIFFRPPHIKQAQISNWNFILDTRIRQNWKTEKKLSNCQSKNGLNGTEEKPSNEQTKSTLYFETKLNCIE